MPIIQNRVYSNKNESSIIQSKLFQQQALAIQSTRGISSKQHNFKSYTRGINRHPPAMTITKNREYGKKRMKTSIKFIEE
jgi:hypothetical protein